MSPKAKTVTEALALTLLSVVAFFLVRTFADIDKLESGALDRNERIGKLEVWVVNQDNRLNRMESKLDEVLKIARESK